MIKKINVKAILFSVGAAALGFGASILSDISRKHEIKEAVKEELDNRSKESTEE